jgi:hypothetical protein
VTGEDPLPAGDSILDWAETETSRQRMAALLDRVAAGEDVTDAEAVEMGQDVLEKMYDFEPRLVGLFNTDRVKALVGRTAAGEQVDDAEFHAALLEAITNMVGTAS